MDPKEGPSPAEGTTGAGIHGLGAGIAIPHCAVEDIKDSVMGVLTLERGLDFHSIDGRRADLFFFLIWPHEARNRHIKLLPAISKFAPNGEPLQRPRSESEPFSARDLLLSSLPCDEEMASVEKVLFQIYLQNMDHFEAIVHLLSSVVPGTISVVETRSAGTYLVRMPHFAAFWTEDAHQEGWIVMAIADKPATNSIIRQIQDITGDPDQQSGVVVTVQNLSCAAETLNFLRIAAL